MPDGWQRKKHRSFRKSRLQEIAAQRHRMSAEAQTDNPGACRVWLGKHREQAAAFGCPLLLGRDDQGGQVALFVRRVEFCDRTTGEAIEVLTQCLPPLGQLFESFQG